MPRNKLSDPEKIARQTISENLRKYSHGMTQAELSEKTGIPTSTLSGYFAQRSTPNAGSLEKIANVLNVSKSDIDPRYNLTLPSNAIPVSHTVSIPIIGTIACGEPITAEQNIDGYREEPIDYVPSGTSFYLKCKGDSMYPTLQDGSYVLIHEQPTVEDGQIAAVLVDDDDSATLKRIHHQGKTVVLSGDNPDFPPIILNKENPGRILGKAVKVSFDL